MEIIRTVSWMKQVGRAARQEDRILGFIPTMGALHKGHASLVQAAKAQCAPVVVSIFVNPKQFGPSEDFQKYPRILDSDRPLLESLGVDYLFAPSPEEIYPKGFRTSVDVEGFGNRLEGRSRPGHFQGVATVVLKLFEIVQPRFAYFGRKDAQQARIIQQMVQDLNLDTEVVVGPIVREPDGLALSSRNTYLSPADRHAATALFRSLEALKNEIIAGERDAAHLIVSARRILDSETGVKVDYVEIVDAETLEPVSRLRGRCLVLIAAQVGKTRLIDNALIEQDGDNFRVTI
ncbi:MAG TPA: pantoate--beta-alanine ligase [Candidatus Limnocylindrales bacterium]|nr:pantoate--beta-alanine ligase [Candidatus Limnocylindrales bacterium]